MAHNHQNLNPHFESVVVGGGGFNFWPQGDQQSANVLYSEYPPFKNSRTPQTTVNLRRPVLVDRPTMGVPFKTEVCLQFQRGHCACGDNCHFAHGTGDTRKVLPHGQELMNKERNVVRDWDDDQGIIAAMKLCRRFCNGDVCPYGQKCHFLHEVPAKFRKRVAASVGTAGTGFECKSFVQSSLNANQVPQRAVFWRTKLCNKWEASGYCPFGSNCYFAHGHSELQALGSHTAKEYGNVSTSRMIPIPATLASPITTRDGTSCENQTQGKECLLCLFKLKGFEKIKRIYADWTDDIPLVHSSPAELGT